MASKTSIERAVRAFDWRAVKAGLAETPALIRHRDDGGRGWLHITCMAPLNGADPADSIAQADLLLDLGLGLDDPAFTEGAWRATPVWHAIAFHPNLALAEHLLKKGASPHYCLFAASWRHDDAAIELLARYGADLEDAANPDSTPFIEAAGTGRLECARALARHGANIDARDARGRTALHILLAKGAPFEVVEAVAAIGCSLDIPGPDGRTAREVVARKKDARFAGLAKS